MYTVPIPMPCVLHFSLPRYNWHSPGKLLRTYQPIIFKSFLYDELKFRDNILFAYERALRGNS